MAEFIPFPECRKVRGGEKEWWLDSRTGLGHGRLAASVRMILAFFAYTVIFWLLPLSFIK